MAPALKLRIPSSLDIDDQITFCIGSLITEWAGCEATFMTMFRCLIDRADDTAQLIWLSFNSTRSRCDMLLRACHTAGLDKTLIGDIEAAISQFKGLSATRNFYCHAYYVAGPETYDETTGSSKLERIEGATLLNDERVFSLSEKFPTRATVNEIKDAVERCAVLNRRSIKILLRVRAQTKAQHVSLPSFPPGSLDH
jgi:hypothetical protein